MPYSDLNYITPSELAQFIHTMSGVTDETLAAKFISDAEFVIDAYVGSARKFYPELTGSLEQVITSGSLSWQHSMFGGRREGYWSKGGTYIEVQGSDEVSLIGQSRLVVFSGVGLVKLASGFDYDAPVGTEFTFRQRSRFPRIQDRDMRGDPRMPFLLKRAVAYQVEYGILYGSEDFGLGDTAVATDPDMGVGSRSYGSAYSEVKTAIPQLAKRGMAVWIAPKARVVLRQLLNTTGHLRG